MDLALTIVILMTSVVAVSALARRVDISAPLVLVVFGFIGSYLRFIPELELTPDLVLLGLLPPLLYAASIRTSLIDFRKNRRPILLLSVGLVIATTLAIGLLVHTLVPGTKWGIAFAVGAVVAPPDAVAATAIAKRVGMPRRVVTILEGESLVNDATAIVALRTAIAAAGGTFSLLTVGRDFLISAVGGLVIGVVVAVVVGRIRRRIDDDLTDVAVSLLTPWIAYLPAEELHSSGVLAVVTAGIILGHTSPAIQSASSRIFERTNWATISFLLENVVFLLIGLQVRSILTDVSDSDLSVPRIVVAAAATLLGVILVRIVWVFPASYLPHLIPAVSAKDPLPSWRAIALVSWAGMRGVVTLAAVFLLPTSTPNREVFILIAFVVAVGTLLLQGLSLPWLVRLLNVPGPDRQEDHLQEATVYQRAATAGLDELDKIATGDESEDVINRLRTRTLDRSNAVWERLGGTVDTPNVVYTRLRTKMLQAERAEVLRIRDSGSVDADVLQAVLNALDVEETILDRLFEESTADREVALVPGSLQGACDHLADYTTAPRPLTPDGCEECLRDQMDWVHLRLCMECGHVGCCDSSAGRHASLHYHDTDHPVMRSFEPGEAWRWCFADDLAG